MSVSPISKLPEAEWQELLSDLNYLNTAEIKSFCRRHSIPYTIAIEAKDGRRKKTGEDDRKGIVLTRIRHFLQTGEVLEETCFRAAVLCSEALPKKLTPDDKLFYGQYDKTNRVMVSLLKELTGGKFRNGAIARIVAGISGAGAPPQHSASSPRRGCKLWKNTSAQIRSGLFCRTERAERRLRTGRNYEQTKHRR